MWSNHRLHVAEASPESAESGGHGRFCRRTKVRLETWKRSGLFLLRIVLLTHCNRLLPSTSPLVSPIPLLTSGPLSSSLIPLPPPLLSSMNQPLVVLVTLLRVEQLFTRAAEQLFYPGPAAAGVPLDKVPVSSVPNKLLESELCRFAKITWG